MSQFNDFLHQQLSDPNVRAQYDALAPEFAIIRALIEARNRSGLTQNELARRTGINQSDISKLEHGNANPSLRTLTRLAQGMGMQLKVEFVVPHASKQKRTVSTAKKLRIKARSVSKPLVVHQK